MERISLERRRAGEKTVAIVKEAWKLTTMAIIVVTIAFIAWSVMNADVLWKAIRYPEAVRQMQIEVVIKR